MTALRSDLQPGRKDGMMKSGLWLMLCGCVLLVDAPASGEEPDCENAMTQMDMTYCAVQDYAKADEALNAQYKITRDAMRARDADGIGETAGAEAALVKAQRAWMAYRDAQCVSYGFQARGGSMEPMLVANCEAELTRSRTDALKELADGLEN